MSKNLSFIGLDGLLSIALTVLAILINFTSAINPEGFPAWFYNALKGWSAIPFIIFAPSLLALGIVLLAMLIVFVAAVVINLFN